MKLLLIFSFIFLANAALAETPWLKRPVIYFYQDNNIILERIGSDEEVNKKSALISNIFLNKSASIKKHENEKPFYLVVIFNDKGKLKFWIDSEDKKREKEWTDFAKNALADIPFKSKIGSTAIAFYFTLEGSNEGYPAKPPILKAWDSEIEKHKKIGASELFNKILEN